MNSQLLSLHEVPYEHVQTLVGFRDGNLAVLSKAFNGPVTFNNMTIKSSLDPESFRQLQLVIEYALAHIEQNGHLETEELNRLINQAKLRVLDDFQHEDLKPVAQTRSGKMIYPKTPNQKRLIEALENHDVTFALGVAGTGKTYLAVAYAASLLKKEKIERIILTRPAVEAGESLGYLPGSMKEKVDPYLTPLYDALYEFFGVEATERMIEKKIVEIAPLAFMRGRTLNQAVVILDEAQNATRAQMKMFLTRMGKNCKMIITGDITQTDLVKKKDSGLLHAWNLLEPVEEIARIKLNSADVMRNPLVQKILEQYEAESESLG